MEKIQRTTQKIFGSNAPADDIAALGSFKTGTPVYTDNVAALQNNAYEQGYGAAIIANEAPFMEEQNSIPYILSKQLAYLYQEGIAEYDTETTYFIGSWVKGIINDKRIIYESLTDNNLGNPLTDQTHWQEIKFGGGSGGSSLPLFTPMLFDHVLEGDEAVGWALQGSLVTNTYPAAVNAIKTAYTSGTDETFTLGDITFPYKKAQNGWQIADIAQKDNVDALFTQTGVAKFYVLDSANNQFYLPRENWFQQLTTDPDKVNQYNEAGLPNIKGNIGSGHTNSVFWTAATVGANGAFYTSGGNYQYAAAGGAGSAPAFVSFDASRSSSIYGNSDTVQPPSSNWLLYYVVGNTITNESEIDIGNVLSDLQLKADTNLANTIPAQSFKDMSVGWGMPDYSRVVSIPLPSIGGSLSYTAESNGYFRLMFSALGVGVTVWVNEQQMGSYTSGGGATSLATYNNVVFQLSKGDTYKISTAQAIPNGSLQTNSSIFIPCKGGYNA